jgi:hypothetical protein
MRGRQSLRGLPALFFGERHDRQKKNKWSAGVTSRVVHLQIATGNSHALQFSIPQLSLKIAEKIYPTRNKRDRRVMHTCGMARALGRKRNFIMKPNPSKGRSGKAPLLLMWLLGVPLPIIGLIFLLQGCHG